MKNSTSIPSNKINGCVSLVSIFAIILLLMVFSKNALSMSVPDFSHFPNHVCEFLTENYINAKRVEHIYGVPSAVTLGVACFESGYGRSFRALNWNACFGIAKRKYESVESSFDDFGDLMNNERYHSILSTDLKDLSTWCNKLMILGYNHHKGYDTRLHKVILFINKRGQL